MFSTTFLFSIASLGSFFVFWQLCTVSRFGHVCPSPRADHDILCAFPGQSAQGDVHSIACDQLQGDWTERTQIARVLPTNVYCFCFLGKDIVNDFVKTKCKLHMQGAHLNTKLTGLLGQNVLYHFLVVMCEGLRDCDNQLQRLALSFSKPRGNIEDSLLGNSEDNRSYRRQVWNCRGFKSTVQMVEIPNV